MVITQASSSHIRSLAASKQASPTAPAPARSDPVDSLGPLARTCVAVGDGVARLGPGGCAAVGAGLGALAMTAVPSLGLPLVGGFLGFLEGSDAAEARRAFLQGPNSQAWRSRDKSAFGGPPRSKSTADAGSHLLVVGSFLAATAAGAAAFGTSSPAGIVAGVVTASVAAVVFGRAGGQAERATVNRRYPGTYR